MLDWIFRRQYVLTHEQAERYASEKDNNFRWVLSLFATYSNCTLTDDDLVSEDLHNEITQLGIFPVIRYDIGKTRQPGQFAELVYSAVPVQFLIENYSTLSQPHYPLEKYDTLRDCLFVDAFCGTCADLPAFIVFQPVSRRLVVSIAGSTSITHMLHNVRCYRTAHPSGRGQVHSGFLRLYEGIKNPLFDGIRQGVEKYSPTELILTGHSMGASIVYLFIIELLAQDDPILPRVKLSSCIFGSPRVGDSDLVDHFLTLVRSFRERFGQDAFREYSIKGYNDGVYSSFLPSAHI